MKPIAKVAILCACLGLAIQFIHPSIPSLPTTAEIAAPRQVRDILRKDCYTCHSNRARLSWFDQAAPGYWLVRHDVLNARQHLNFSTIGEKPVAQQRAALYEGVNMIAFQAMPLPAYTRLHPNAKVSAEDLAALKTFLAPWSTPAPMQSNAPQAPADLPNTPVYLASVSKELNGFAFDPNFEQWTPLSFTDRGDNNTFRFVLGNDIAVKAARTGAMHPWPDGARLAKVAWQQVSGPDGLIHAGKFVQVELMHKDATTYKGTEGWGWGRWRGMELKPYGMNAHFVNECTGCHMPMKKDDYVYTPPITEARLENMELVNNKAAALPANLPYQPLAWRAVTIYTDPKSHTLSVLFGNADEMSQLTRLAGPAEQSTLKQHSGHPVLALVTWKQRDDPHWFGARIPDAALSVEFVEKASSGGGSKYRDFRGASEQYPSAAFTQDRVTFITSLKPANLPLVLQERMASNRILPIRSR